MKRLLLVFLAACFLLSGCSSWEAYEESAAAEVTEAASASVIYPLPDTTMEDLDDTILSVSLEEGDAYVDDTGIMRMDVTVYSYDTYDMVDISALKVGDVLATHEGEVEIAALAREENGTVLINGGLDEEGFDLVTDETGIYFVRGYNDGKSWYEVGEATIRVSVDFLYHDTSDPEKGEILYYPGSFLIGEVTDYNFTPCNTTIRVENSQIVEMYRVYIP